MNRSDQPGTLPGGGILSQGVVEGTMEPSLVAGVDFASGDEAFKKFQQNLLQEFHARYDEWSRRAVSGPESSRFGILPATMSLGEILRYRDSPEEKARRDAAFSRRFDLVWDFARLCGRFVNGDLWGWAHYLQRSGVSIDDIVELAPDRARQTINDTRVRKWRPGLSLLGIDAWEIANLTFGSIDDIEWIKNAWSVVVEEFIGDYVQEILRPALEEPRPATSQKSLDAATRNREAVDEFRKRVMLESAGERISKLDVALLAGYRTPRELQGFQRGDKLGASATRNIKRALEMSPLDAKEALPRLRERHRLWAAQRKAN
jgi:hypothetical protein